MRRIIAVFTLTTAFVSAATIFAAAAGNPSIEPEQTATVRTHTKVLNSPTFCMGSDGHQYATIAWRIQGTWLGGRFSEQRFVMRLTQTYRTDDDRGWASGDFTVKDAVDPSVPDFKGTFQVLLAPATQDLHSARGWLDGVLYQSGQATTQHILANLEGSVSFSTTSSEFANFTLGGQDDSGVGLLAISTNEDPC
jgi:hypothetical protein